MTFLRVPSNIGTKWVVSQFIYCYQLISTPGHPSGSEKHGVGELWGGGVQINHTWPVAYKRLGYCSQNQPSLTQLLDDADESFFDRIKMNSDVLQPYLPERPEICYRKIP